MRRRETKSRIRAGEEKEKGRRSRRTGWETIRKKKRRHRVRMCREIKRRRSGGTG